MEERFNLSGMVLSRSFISLRKISDNGTILVEEMKIKPITDIRATKEYRMHMAKIMFERGLNAAVSRLNGGGPEYGKNLI